MSAGLLSVCAFMHICCVIAQGDIHKRQTDFSSYKSDLCLSATSLFYFEKIRRIKLHSNKKLQLTPNRMYILIIIKPFFFLCDEWK